MYEPPRRTERPCLDCNGTMVIQHKGEFATIYVCRACGTSLTIPPKLPLAPEEPTPGGQS